MAYSENLDKLCNKVFNGKSADAVICGYKEGEMALSKNEIHRLRHGNFNKKENTRKLFEQYFRMPWCEIVSYIKYGERGRDLPKGYSASLLRKKLEEELKPDLNVLLPYLGITAEEWTKALTGENELCYFMSDELEAYFDFSAGYLRGTNTNIQTTNCFTPYSKEENQNDIGADKSVDLEEKLKRIRQTAETSLWGISDSIIIKSKEKGVQVFIESENATALLYRIAFALSSENRDTKPLIKSLNQQVDKFWE